jgi:NAD+ synthase (glutamine-hydrolysing)
MPATLTPAEPVPQAVPVSAPPTRSGYRVALAQIAPLLGDRPRNLRLHLERIEQARSDRADLIVFPELSLTGYFLRDMVPEVALSPAAPEIAELIEACGPLAAAVGFVEETPQHAFHNSALFVEGGQVAHLHRKVFLPTYGMFDEQRYFAEGERLRAFDSPKLGRVGLLICEDFWHLSAVAVMQAEGVDLLICMANSPGRGVDGPKLRTAETYDLLCRTFAQTLGAAVVFVNRVGFEDGLCFWGGSMVVGPDGRHLGQAPMFDEAQVYVDFDAAELRRERIATPLARDERLLLLIEELQRVKRRRYAD